MSLIHNSYKIDFGPLPLQAKNIFFQLKFEKKKKLLFKYETLQSVLIKKGFERNFFIFSDFLSIDSFFKVYFSYSIDGKTNPNFVSNILYL